MKKTFTVSILLLSAVAWCNVGGDFSVTDIFVGNDGFIRIKLKNKSTNSEWQVEKNREKVFLVFFLNHTRRSEYKVKHIPVHFFKTPGKTTVVNHFRETVTVIARAEVNLAPVFPEDNKDDNCLENRLRYD